MRACAPAALRSACIEIALYHDLHSSAGGADTEEGATDRVKVKRRHSESNLSWSSLLMYLGGHATECPLLLSFIFFYFYFVAVAS